MLADNLYSKFQPDAEKTEFINPSGEKKETLNIALELKSSKTDLMDPGQQIVRWHKELAPGTSH